MLELDVLSRLSRRIWCSHTVPIPGVVMHPLVVVWAEAARSSLTPVPMLRALV